MCVLKHSVLMHQKTFSLKLRRFLPSLFTQKTKIVKIFSKIITFDSKISFTSSKSFGCITIFMAMLEIYV
jgi:hypothetical protein